MFLSSYFVFNGLRSGPLCLLAVRLSNALLEGPPCDILSHFNLRRNPHVRFMTVFCWPVTDRHGTQVLGIPDVLQSQATVTGPLGGHASVGASDYTGS